MSERENERKKENIVKKYFKIFQSRFFEEKKTKKKLFFLYANYLMKWLVCLYNTHTNIINSLNVFVVIWKKKTKIIISFSISYCSKVLFAAVERERERE